MSSQSVSACDPALGGGANAPPWPDCRLDLRPDWRNAESYRHLLGLDRAGWAWEWLRRNPDYKADAHEDLADGREEGVSRITVLHPGFAHEVSRWGLSFRGGALQAGIRGAAPLGYAVRSVGADGCRASGCLG